MDSSNPDLRDSLGFPNNDPRTLCLDPFPATEASVVLRGYNVTPVDNTIASSPVLERARRYEGLVSRSNELGASRLCSDLFRIQEVVVQDRKELLLRSSRIGGAVGNYLFISKLSLWLSEEFSSSLRWAWSSRK